MSRIEPHDEFLELCAVSTSGQLTEEGQRRLQEHLVVCASCREALQQYEAIVRHAIPAIAAEQTTPENLEPGPNWSEKQAESILFERIAREERRSRIEPSPPIQSRREASPRRVLSPVSAVAWRNVWALYAAGILLFVALGFCAYEVGIRRGVGTAKVVARATNTQHQSSLEAQVSNAAHEREVVLAQIGQRDRQIADLRKQLERQSVELTQMKAAQDHLVTDLSNKDAGAQNLVQQQAELQQKFDAAQANAGVLQQRLDALSKQSGEDQARAGQLMAQVKDLTQALRDRDAALDQKDELLAKDRDVRELIGARDLHVVESHDVDSTGKTQKTYARAFYSKEKSLIFYAYDLDLEPGAKSSNVFQAWGQRGPDRTQALSLGIFYVDNSSKKRWVLKLDDPKVLAQIDAVFVTVEPNVGSRKPSGKPLLFAYLGVDPNHP